MLAQFIKSVISVSLVENEQNLKYVCYNQTNSQFITNICIMYSTNHGQHFEVISYILALQSAYLVVFYMVCLADVAIEPSLFPSFFRWKIPNQLKIQFFKLNQSGRYQVLKTWRMCNKYVLISYTYAAIIPFHTACFANGSLMVKKVVPFGRIWLIYSNIHVRHKHYAIQVIFWDYTSF